MKPNKTFDCVEMKNRIQEQLQKEYEGMNNEEIRSRINSKLENSDTPVGKVWRILRARERSIQPK